MNDSERKALWDNYRKTSSPEIKEKIIIEYAPLVKLVAGRLSMYLGYTVEYDDLVGYGVFGLIDAIDKFDSAKDVKFETYASLRIRGAIIDQIRKMDWIPRTVRQKQKKMESAIKAVEARLGRPATDEEIAVELGITDDEYLDWQGQMKVTNVVSLDEFMESGADVPKDAAPHSETFDSPEEAIEKEELKKVLAQALELLTDKEKKVILLYYYEELTLKEIASVLEVSESRVSQLHTKGLQKMRTRM
ncbi:MAG: FliA/WhiG family RNA polymerase sigma factor, partial [Lachnospiraceae bacterium]|nr:FliA/WhiG family RNA polymerase sigma factor [Lachnospiraceae bacterium]